MVGLFGLNMKKIEINTVSDAKRVAGLADASIADCIRNTKINQVLLFGPMLPPITSMIWLHK